MPTARTRRPMSALRQGANDRLRPGADIVTTQAVFFVDTWGFCLGIILDRMAGSSSNVFDVDAQIDPHIDGYRRAAALLHGADWQRGLEDMERLAHQGSIMSMLSVSDSMRAGWGYEQDLPGAEAWYRVAAASGSARGVFGLGLTHLLMKRFDEAIQEFETAIAQGYTPAYNSLAGMYFRGDGVATDRKRALELWRKGAQLGHLPAKRNLLTQRIEGHYGISGRLAGWLDLLPYACEFVAVRRSNSDTDRLR